MSVCLARALGVGERGKDAGGPVEESRGTGRTCRLLPVSRQATHTTCGRPSSLSSLRARACSARVPRRSLEDGERRRTMARIDHRKDFASLNFCLFFPWICCTKTVH
jgi:hypothetical protein